jgi:hypothetical protein
MSSIARSTAQNTARAAHPRFTQRNSDGVKGKMARQTSAVTRKKSGRLPILM